jgi:hypothetical protein
MSLEDTELKIGNTSFKGVYIAILFSLATTLGGGVWTASSLYSRLEAVEAIQIPNIVPLEEEVLLIKQELEDNDVSKLQGKLAELGTNLVVIKEQQTGLLLIQSQVSDLDKEIEAQKAVVAKAELITEDMKELKEKLKKIGINVDDIWTALDYMSNPLN